MKRGQTAKSGTWTGHRNGKLPMSPSSPVLTLPTSTPDSDDEFGRWEVTPDTSIRRDTEPVAKLETQRIQTSHPCPQRKPHSVPHLLLPQKSFPAPKAPPLTIKSIGLRPATKSSRRPNPIRTMSRGKNSFLSSIPLLPLWKEQRESVLTQTDGSRAHRQTLSPQFRLYEPDLKKAEKNVPSMPSMPHSLRVLRPGDGSPFMRFSFMSSPRLL